MQFKDLQNFREVTISDPQAVADLGEKIYKEKYQAAFEAEHRLKFVAIDVETEKAYIGDQPEQALSQARKDSPNGYFHLIRVGSSGAYRVGYVTNHARSRRLFRQGGDPAP